MPKAFMVVQYHSIQDLAKLQAYSALATDAIAAAGGRFIVRGVAARAMEAGKMERTVVIEFDSLDVALGLYDRPDYQAAVKALDGAAVRDMRIVEGVA